MLTILGVSWFFIRYSLNTNMVYHFLLFVCFFVVEPGEPDFSTAHLDYDQLNKADRTVKVCVVSESHWIRGTGIWGWSTHPTFN